MEALWFGVASLMAAVYVVLDGFDFGAGALHHLVARNDRERRQVLAAIGPYWDGNEVWLIALGGTLFLAFPRVLASGLSGLYLAIFLVTWVLILRGTAIELRSHLADGMWRSFWDAVFALASTLLPVLFGVALGNLLRGVPLDAEGWFQLSFFESFSPWGALGLLDWYTVLAGLLALVAVTHHGALFLAWKTRDAVRDRARAWAARLFPAILVLWLGATVATTAVAPQVGAGLRERPLAWGATALLLTGIAACPIARRRGRDLAAFLASSAFLLGMLAATAASVYPTLIRAVPDAELSLTTGNSAAGPKALAAGLLWWPAGLALVVVYYVVLFRLHRGRVRVGAET